MTRRESGLLRCKKRILCRARRPLEVSRECCRCPIGGSVICDTLEHNPFTTYSNQYVLVVS